MAQIYKVFIKDSCIILTDSPTNAGLVYEGASQLRSLYYQLDRSPKTEEIYVYHHSLSELWQEFVGLFEWISAAGGVVINGRGELLLIHRLGKWDLPKGKVEESEDIREAAIREVMEECHLPEPAITQSLPNTYHTYTLDDVPILKCTYWFEMKIEGVPPLKPQMEEGITEALWCAPEYLPEKMKNTYPNISRIFEAYCP